MHQPAKDFIELKFIQIGMTRTQLEFYLDRPDKIWHYNTFYTPAPVWSYENIHFMFNKDKLVLVFEQNGDTMTKLLTPDSS